MIWKRLRLTLEMIKFEHSVFALPFALTGALLAFRDSGFDGAGIWRKLAWIVAAMVCARSAAMAFNRLVDQDIDGRNPRTRSRHLPAGLLSCSAFQPSRTMKSARPPLCARKRRSTEARA